jgi:uncharacterized membrane protein
VIVLPPHLRRVIYCLVFEAIAIAVSVPLLWALGGGDPYSSVTVAVLVSVIAVSWNYVFNALFEAWERRSHLTSRTPLLRCAHAAMFETGLIAATVPLYMVWYGVTLWHAFAMEVWLLLFFFAYTYAFTWAFDKVFTLPNARGVVPGEEHAARGTP